MEKITHLVLDVDGTLTDSGIYFDDQGNELKRFSTRDYAGILAAHYIGIKVVVITGRESPITQRRINEMKVDLLFQGEKDKSSAIKRLVEQYEVSLSQIAYIVDDLNDLAALSTVGFKACPADACLEIKKICDYISPIRGGQGVVQDVLRHMLSKISKWESFISDVIMRGY